MLARVCVAASTQKVVQRNRKSLLKFLASQHGNGTRRNYSTNPKGASKETKPREPPKEGLAFRLIGPFFQKAYVVNVVPTLSTGILAGLVAATTGWWYYLGRTPESKEWREKHLACSLENWNEGRYYTMLASAFNTQPGGIAGAVTTVLGIITFGGVASRVLSGPGLFAFYLGSQAFSASAALAASKYQYDNVLSLRDSLLATGGFDQASPSTSFIGEKRKLVAGLERVEQLAPGQDEKVREFRDKLYSMSDKEILDLAADRYGKRFVPAFAGCIGLAVLTVRTNLYGLLPLAFFPVPLVAVAAIYSTMPFSLYRDYHELELLSTSVGPAVVYPLAAAVMLKLGSHSRQEMPLEYLKKLKLDSWAKAKPTATVPAAPKTPFSPDVTNMPSPQAIAAMRRRNEAIQRKSQGQPPAPTKPSPPPPQTKK